MFLAEPSRIISAGPNIYEVFWKSTLDTEKTTSAPSAFLFVNIFIFVFLYIFYICIFVFCVLYFWKTTLEMSAADTEKASSQPRHYRLFCVNRWINRNTQRNKQMSKMEVTDQILTKKCFSHDNMLNFGWEKLRVKHGNIYQTSNSKQENYFKSLGY